MFDIPELDEMICRQLRKHDLAICARVSRKWHKVVIPFLWSNLALVYHRSRSLFSQAILKDYLQLQKQRRSQEQVRSTRRRAPPPPPVSRLAKYSCYIQKLAKPEDLIGMFKDALTLPVEGPTTYDLYLHLLDISPSARIASYLLGYPERYPDPIWHTITERIIPHVVNLHIFTHNQQTMKANFLMELLDRCSSFLKELKIHAALEDPCDGADDIQMEHEEDNTAKGWMSLQYLGFSCWIDHPAFNKFQRRLLKRCRAVQTLVLYNIAVISQGFAEDVVAYMPNLKVITIGSRQCRVDVTDNLMVMLLSASRDGWTSLKFGPVRFGEAARTALAKHFSTLVELDVTLCRNFTSADLVQVMSSCPNLHALNDFYANESRIDANTFIDRNPTTGSLKSWACETSLRVLKTKIMDIPRPDLIAHGWGNGGLILEAYDGQGRAIQNLVYDRLARLVNLVSLVLTSTSGGRNHYSCLEFSLGSGLQKLEGLKALHDLDVSRMTTRIGLEEIQWMVEHWPRFHIFRGWLENRDDTMTWLIEHQIPITVIEQ
ncbi:MAG: hypothetical protein J3Q66DRAFT_350562 [Benniella sp.]|nr:MAG: hypothetical protein J3Q66DRAFT_350562 [Benniella sp.]